MTDKLDEQQQRFQASMALLESMGQLADEIVAERGKRRELEESFNGRRCKPKSNNPAD